MDDFGGHEIWGGVVAGRSLSRVVVVAELRGAIF